MIKLQVAMDMTDLDLYWKVLEEVHDLADIIEIGLIAHRGGSVLIEQTREKYPDSVIVWDTKEAHFITNSTIIPLKPDYLSVASFADIENIEATVKMAHEYGVKVIGDFLPGHNGPDDVIRMCSLGVDQVSAHPNADSRKYPMGDTFVYDYVKALAPEGMEISTYGGFTPENVLPLLERKPDIVVVGQSIWKDNDPRESTKRWKKLLAEYDNK